MRARLHSDRFGVFICSYTIFQAFRTWNEVHVNLWKMSWKFINRQNVSFPLTLTKPNWWWNLYLYSGPKVLDHLFISDLSAPRPNIWKKNPSNSPKMSLTTFLHSHDDLRSTSQRLNAGKELIPATVRQEIIRYTHTHTHTHTHTPTLPTHSHTHTICVYLYIQIPNLAFRMDTIPCKRCFFTLFYLHVQISNKEDNGFLSPAKQAQFPTDY